MPTQIMAAYQCQVCETVRPYGTETPVAPHEPLLRCDHCAKMQRHTFIGLKTFLQEVVVKQERITHIAFTTFGNAVKHTAAKSGV